MSEKIFGSEVSLFDRKSATKLIASLSVFLTLVACGDKKPSDEVRSNHPPAAEYYLNEDDYYYQQLDETKVLTNDPDAIKTIERLQETPVAQWLNEDIGTTKQTISENLANSVAEGKVPVFVAYNIPDRDLGSESSGGFSEYQTYKDWINTISESIGDAPALIVVEPDALADVPNMSHEAGVERIQLLHDVLKGFSENNPNLAVYLDVGNSKWLSVEDVAELIKDVDQNSNIVTGIALNVSFQSSTESTRTYAESIFKMLGRPLKVLSDVSMNGSPLTDELTEWCNPAGEKIGTPEDNEYDPEKSFEEVFIKTPGESDGQCGASTKMAGEYDPILLLEQVS